MNLKLKRLESLAQRELSLWLISQSKNDALKAISVNEIRITNDLSYMYIYYTVFKDNNVDFYKDLLETYKVLIRQTLAHKIKARKMPELVFKYDETLNYGNKIDKIIDDLNK